MDNKDLFTETYEKYDYLKTYFYYFGEVVFIGETAHKTVATVISPDNESVQPKEFIITNYNLVSELYDLVDEYNQLTDAQSAFDERSSNWWNIEDDIQGVEDDIYNIITCDL